MKSDSKIDCKCLRCGHVWQSRVDNPQECPNCKSRNWDKEKVVE